MRSKLLGLAGLALACATSPVMAATINLNADPNLVNPSFETGTLSPWVQSQNGGGVYAPTSADYTAGSDGLASGIVPDGTHVAFVPGSGGNGAGVLQQEINTTFVNGNTYNLSVWVAMPLVVQGTAGAVGVQGTGNCTGLGPGGCANHTDHTTFSIDLYYDPTAHSGSIANGGLSIVTAQDAVTISSLGVWALYTVSVSCTSSTCNGKDIVVQLRDDSTSIDQPHQNDFDIAAVSATPLPAAVWLFGSVIGLGGAVGLRRRKAKLA